MANNEKVGALNRIKVVLIEQGKTNRWLAEKLSKAEHVVAVHFKVGHIQGNFWHVAGSQDGHAFRRRPLHEHLHRPYAPTSD